MENSMNVLAVFMIYKSDMSRGILHMINIPEKVVLLTRMVIANGNRY